jgi:hypothetical protein
MQYKLNHKRSPIFSKCTVSNGIASHLLSIQAVSLFAPPEARELLRVNRKKQRPDENCSRTSKQGEEQTREPRIVILGSGRAAPLTEETSPSSCCLPPLPYAAGFPGWLCFSSRTLLKMSVYPSADAGFESQSPNLGTAEPRVGCSDPEVIRSDIAHGNGMYST